LQDKQDDVPEGKTENAVFYKAAFLFFTKNGFNKIKRFFLFDRINSERGKSIAKFFIAYE